MALVRRRDRARPVGDVAVAPASPARSARAAFATRHPQLATSRIANVLTEVCAASVRVIAALVSLPPIRSAPVRRGDHARTCHPRRRWPWRVGHRRRGWRGRSREMQPAGRGRQSTMYTLPRWRRCYRKYRWPVIGHVTDVRPPAPPVESRSWPCTRRRSGSRTAPIWRSLAPPIRRGSASRSTSARRPYPGRARRAGHRRGGAHTAHDLLAIAREVRRLAEDDPPGPPRANAARNRSEPATVRQDG